MRNEADFKAAIKKSVRAQGGYCFSTTGAVTAGIPDLFVSMPGFIPVLLEAKWMKFGYKRKINITPIQRKTLQDINKVNPSQAFIICGFKDEENITRAVLIDANKTHIEDSVKDSFCYTGQFDIKWLFNNAKIGGSYTRIY